MLLIVLTWLYILVHLKLFLFFSFLIYGALVLRCIKHLQKQSMPKGVELADDEFILYVEGTATTQRVVRHIGGTSWPGLPFTNLHDQV